MPKFHCLSVDACVLVPGTKCLAKHFKPRSSDSLIYMNLGLHWWCLAIIPVHSKFSKLRAQHVQTLLKGIDKLVTFILLAKILIV